MLITQPQDFKAYAPTKRIWQGIPGMVGTEKGRLFATWYSGGTKEEFGNYCLLAVSDDSGESWRDPIAVAAPDDPTRQRCYDPNVWISPDGALWFFYTMAQPCGLFAAVCREPDAATLVWEEPRLIAHDVMMNKPIVASDGAWLLPVAVWNKGVFAGSVHQRKDDDPIERGSFVYASTDGGKTFVKRGGADVKDRSYDEHMLLEKKDGSLEVYVRTVYGIGKSVSHDGGRTWGAGYDSGLGGPCSRFFITRLRSGRLLLVNHVNGGKLRKNLAAMLSEDDGKTWSAPLLLDGRDNVSYPDGFEAADGTIYITYDRERGAFRKSAAEALGDAREILFARFREEDILAGRIVSADGCLQKKISRLGVYDGDPESLYRA